MAYRSVLTVVTPAGDYSLVDLATAKDELGITDGTTDARITRWIKEASRAMQTCIDRILIAEAVSERFRLIGYPANYPRDAQGEHFYPRSTWDDPGDASALLVKRFPIVSVSSITEDGSALDPADFEIDADKGFIYRLSGNDRVPWTAQIIVVAYTGGYVLADVPEDLQAACLIVLKHRLASANRDPMVRAINVPGVLEQQFWVGQQPGSSSSLPPEVEAALQTYQRVTM